MDRRPGVSAFSFHNAFAAERSTPKKTFRGVDSTAGRGYDGRFRDSPSPIDPGRSIADDLLKAVAPRLDPSSAKSVGDKGDHGQHDEHKE